MSTQLVAPASTNPSGTASAESIRQTPDNIDQLVRPSRWVRLCQEFLKCHRRPVNILLHLITTPLGLFGFLSLVQPAGPLVTTTLVVIYLGVVCWMVPATVWLVSATVMFAIWAMVHYLTVSWFVAGAFLGLGYFGQELAHWFAHEPTLQNTYSGKRGMLGRFVEHTVLLLPVLLTIAGRRRQSPLRILVSRKAVLSRRLTSSIQREDLARIREWVEQSQPNLTQSTHWWQHDLEGESQAAFDRLSHDRELISMIRRFHGPGYQVQPVLGMNELYVTGPPKSSTSDTVFYRSHVDGPWAVFPGARLYRCMLAASPNAQVTTHYPMCGTDYDQPEGYRLETGDAVAFDFNRELHFITRQTSAPQPEPRVNLKLHFVAYPISVSWYGRLLANLTTDYDVRARKLFLQTIDPNSPWQKFKAKWVLGWTKIFEMVVRFVGWTNLAYVLVMAGLSLALGDGRWFIAATSFVHYAIYLGTFREHGPVAFGIFRRDAVFFKSLALAQLFLLYLIHFSGNWLSLAIVMGGFALATYATAVLGINRTYFSSELGIDDPQRITRFPYGVIPHPMVLGAMIGIAAMWMLPGIQVHYGWLILGHLAFYLVVLAQEIVLTRHTHLSNAARSSTT